jgi:endonuclease/exonuclease/phosphatase family metal-dependent hydrolase
MRELAEFCAKNEEPFIIGGDFNVVRFGHEKNKNYHHSRFSDVFNSIIQTYELREIPMSGGGYTWSSNHESPTMKKLDRVLVTREWQSLFPNV